MSIISKVTKIRTCLTELVGLVEHVKCCSPFNIAVQWNLQCLRKSTKDLGTLEVLDTLSRCLNLNESGVWQREMLSLLRTTHLFTYLDSQSSDFCNNIEGATENVIVFTGGIIFPDGCGVFDSHDLCDLSHHINVSEVDNMS